MVAYRIFTVSSAGLVSKGATVSKLTLKGAGIDIPAVIVGEEGRSRSRGILPVQLSNRLYYKEWQEKGSVIINAAEVGQTKAGKPKLFVKNGPDIDEKIIVVFRTKIGFRGGNSHTGDRTGETEKDVWGGERPKFHPFPGEKLISGTIAQGAAGRMGSGEQLVAVMPKDTVFRTGYSGRLYGSPNSHYYKWDGQQLLALSWDERVASDLF